MKKNLLLIASAAALSLGVGAIAAGSVLATEAPAKTHATGTTVTYAATSASAVSTTGTAPSGSSASISGGSWNSTAGMVQLTSGNSSTFTLSGYKGYKITGITLSMRSNSKAGKGSLSATVGTTTVCTISDSAFNTANWNGAWSTTAVNKALTLSSSPTIEDGENLVITISASANSLYVGSWAITYEEASSTKTLSSIALSGTLADQYIGAAFDATGLTVTATYDDSSTSNITASVTWSVTTVSAETTSVTATYGGKTTNALSFTPLDPSVEPSVVESTVAEINALKKSDDTQLYRVTGVVSSIDNTTIGNLKIQDASGNTLVIYGTTVTTSALVWNGASGTRTYTFTNPQDFSTDPTTSAIKVGDRITMRGTLVYYSSKTMEFQGILETRVAEALTSIEATPTKTEYYVGNSVTASDFTVQATYAVGGTKSIASSSCTISPSTLNSEGDHTITITYTDDYGTQSDTFEVHATVFDAHVTSVTVAKNAEEIKVGDEVQINATILPADATYGLTYAIKDGQATDVASVSDSGLVTGLKIGRTIVVVGTDDPDYTGDCPEVVIDVCDSVIARGDTFEAITKEADLVAGMKIVISATTGGGNSFVATQTVTSQSATASYLTHTEAGDMKKSTLASCIYTLGGQKDAWTLANLDGDLLGATAAKVVGFNLTDAVTTWKISIASTGIATMTSTTESYGSMKYNGSSPRFTTYASGQTAISLNKLGNGEVLVKSNLLNAISAAKSAYLTCDPNGESSSIYWATLQWVYNGTTASAGYTLTDADREVISTTLSDPSGNAIEQLVSVYDYLVVEKDYPDFMGRKDNGLITVSTAAFVSYGVESVNALPIAVIAASGLVASAGLIILRKKQH